MVHSEPTIFVQAEGGKGQIGGFTVAQTTPERITSLGPFQPYEIPGTGYVGEQDFAGWEVKEGAISLFYPTGFTPTSDLLSAISYGFGIPPFIAGLIDGFNTPLSAYYQRPESKDGDEKGAIITDYTYSAQRAKDRLEYAKAVLETEKLERPASPKKQLFYRIENPVYDSNGELTDYKVKPIYLLEEFGDFPHPDAFPSVDLAE